MVKHDALHRTIATTSLELALSNMHHHAELPSRRGNGPTHARPLLSTYVAKLPARRNPVRSRPVES
jgi:hypothetical protein